MPQYIEIKHVGIEQKFIKPLFVCTKALNIEVKGEDVVINNQKTGQLTERDKMIFSNGDYSTLIIDEKTFQKLFTFIEQYSQFVKNHEDKKSVNYSIIFNGEKFDISYRQTHAFFSDLAKSLKTGNYEKDSVNALVSYFNSNFY